MVRAGGPSTSFAVRDLAGAGKLVDARAKPWHDEMDVDLYSAFRTTA